MDKIFDKETEEYLLSAGVSQREIYKIKFNKGKEGVLKILKKITTLIEEEKFADVNSYLASSPAGDDMGCDNAFINFLSVFSTDPESEDIDIDQACDILRDLKRQL